MERKLPGWQPIQQNGRPTEHSPLIFDSIKEKYPQVEIIPQTSFTMGTAINNDEVALTARESGADVCIIGNAA